MPQLAVAAVVQPGCLGGKQVRHPQQGEDHSHRRTRKCNLQECRGQSGLPRKLYAHLTGPEAG